MATDGRNDAAFNAIVGDPRIVDLTISDARDLAATCAGATREFLAERTKQAIELTRDWTEKPARPLAIEDTVYRLWNAARAAGDDFLLMDVVQVLIYARDLQ